MPTYEYKCQACGFEFEKFQSITAASLRKCPHCGKSRLKRLMGTGAALIFKGPGFYTTDYRSDSYKTAAKADTASPPESKETKTGATDAASKPAAESKPATDSKPATESKAAADPKPAKPSKQPKNSKSDD